MPPTPTPTLARTLTDARLQLHHAAQLATAMGISYLSAQPDDSHTNLEWRTELGALASRAVPGAPSVRVGVRMTDMTLLLLDDAYDGLDAYALHGQTITSATEWVRACLAAHGIDASRYTLAKHYAIPFHRVDSGAAFDASDSGSFGEVSRWFESASIHLEHVQSRNADATEIRCWPHHFDLATLVTPVAGASIGVGLEPGDAYYDEPYYYVNMYPVPAADALTERLAGGGSWHTSEWIGAVLPGSRLIVGDGQRAQVTAFLDSAIGAARGHVMHSRE